MTAVARLAEFIVTAQPSSDLESIIAPAIVDCFGCILAGATSEVAQCVRRALSPFGPGTAPLFGTDLTLSAPFAAQINSVAGHAWDLDDWEEPGNTHPTVVLLPALLAAGTLKKVSGGELMAAYAVGAEIIMRLGEAVTLDHYARGFHSTATLGTIGAAGAVSRLLGLTHDQSCHALAMSVSQATGYTMQFGSNAKPLQAGWACRAGLESAVLAAQGITGRPGVLDHPRGFAGLMGQFDVTRFNERLARLGDPWALWQYGLVLKPWPSCGYTHRLMTAALDARAELKERLGEITAIRATLPDFHAEILPFHIPSTRNEALFSVPACVGQILVSGCLTLRDSANAFWENRDVDILIRKTEVVAVPAKRPDLNYDPDQPDVLFLTLSSGEKLEVQCAYPLGAPRRPMTRTHLEAKFCDLTGASPAIFSKLLNWPQAENAAAFFQRTIP